MTDADTMRAILGTVINEFGYFYVMCGLGCFLGTVAALRGRGVL